MDDFGGRTDDDLFADDFEPVSEPVSTLVVEPQPQTTTNTTPAPVPAPVPLVENQPSAPAPSKPTQPATVPIAPKSLAQSRHAPTKPAHQPRPRKHSPKPPKQPAPFTTPAAESTAAATEEDGDTSYTGAPTQATTGPSATSSAPTKPSGRHSSNTASGDRTGSGSNPRTKLTETELAAKMEQMRILSAEKTRRFEQAERDSRSHALAYEKGMEDARKRRAEEAERRKRGDEERRRMDDERERNRERKLKAMGAKDGGSWDEGKNVEEERDYGYSQSFKSANGGVRGSRTGMGMAGSRFAERNDAPPPQREFAADEFRGRGRGRGRGTTRGGRGGRGGSFGDGERGSRGDQNGSSHQQHTQVPPKPDDFPALSGSDTINVDTTTNKPSELPKLPSLSGPNSPLGKWDDEMAALDAKASGT
ncbi:Uu.00g131000.m01.CDS01 [Anthostomella pinea]|uniref:Uu.00g131000.m01.CDS01 n=1 Tax=Anthostomella pinea TaxID=933095 RepID=A0AAI8VJE3_9PEZI|nr:Uu.00g131000.m01.CDS01 [Anthostomella pinea]